MQPDLSVQRNVAEAIDRQPYGAVVRQIGEVAAREGIEAYAVGGMVRDLLLGRTTTDLDFLTVGEGTGIRLAEAVAERLGGTTVHVYPRFGTAAIRLPEAHGTDVLEFVAARRESYRSTSRKPIVEDGTLSDDLRRRDFTVNALAYKLWPVHFGDLLDPFGGLEDLGAQMLRTPLDPAQTFDDDPLRMVRAARFAAQLAFRVADDARAAMRQHADRIAILSQERITEELQKLIAAPVPSIGFKVLEETGLLHHILPELTDLKGVEERRGERHKDNFYHTLQVLDNLSAATADQPADATRYLRWAALLHDIGKAQTKRFHPQHGWTFHGHQDVSARRVPKLFKRLKLPTDERQDYVQKLIALHHRPHALVDEDVTDSAVRRLLFEAGDDVDDLMQLVRADVTSKNPRRVARYLKGFDHVEERMAEVEERDHLRQFQPPVDGHEIMEALGITEGLAVGLIKDQLREAILEGDIPNEHDAAYRLMLEIKDEALRRGRLFERVLQSLEGRERAAMGTIKARLAHPDPLPQDDDAAFAVLMDVKEEALRERFGEDAVA